MTSDASTTRDSVSSVTRGSAVAPETPLLTAESLTRRYTRSGSGGLARLLPWRDPPERPTVTAVDDVSLSVRRGDLVGLAGPSGSGKSTLLHLLAGLERPDDGRVRFERTDLTTLSSRELTRHRLREVGVVFQRFHLLDSFSARANVALPLLELGVAKRERRERAEALLERVGLGDRIEHRPGQLSGGEQQRVAIARALATEPALVIADEPTGELDRAAGERVLEALADVATDRAVVVASHDEATLAVADRVVELRDGRRVDRAADRSGESSGDGRRGGDGRPEPTPAADADGRSGSDPGANGPSGSD